MGGEVGAGRRASPPPRRHRRLRAAADVADVDDATVLVDAKVSII